MLRLQGTNYCVKNETSRGRSRRRHTDKLTRRKNTRKKREGSSQRKGKRGRRGMETDRPTFYSWTGTDGGRRGRPWRGSAGRRSAPPSLSWCRSSRTNPPFPESSGMRAVVWETDIEWVRECDVWVMVLSEIVSESDQVWYPCVCRCETKKKYFSSTHRDDISESIFIIYREPIWSLLVKYICTVSGLTLNWNRR